MHIVPFVPTRLGLLMLAAAVLLAAATACTSPSAPSADAVAPAGRPDPALATSQPGAFAPIPTLPPLPTVPAPTALPRRSDPIDERVALGPAGPQLHLACDGSGPVTVVLIAGFGDGGDRWDTVAPTLAQNTRVCTYDRFGTGSSDLPTSTQTFATEADDLHTLLHSAGEVGPYLVVGHSFGGAEAVAFTHRFGDEVQGLLLLDASPPDWPAAVCAVPDNGSDVAAEFRQTCTMVSTPEANPELLAAPEAFAEVAAISSLGDVPMVVVTAAQHPRPGLDPAVVVQLDAVWNRGQQHWAALSSNVKLMSIPDTGHYIQLDRPDVVIVAVLRLAATS